MRWSLFCTQNNPQRSRIWLARVPAQRILNPPRVARAAVSNMNVEAIKSKYIGDTGLSVSVDIEALRESAKNLLADANQQVFNQKQAEKRKNAVMGMPDDSEWNKRWKARKVNDIKEQRRSIKVAQDMLNEVSAILDKAEAKLAEVK